MAEFKEKFIAFIDILGFKSLIERAHDGDEVTLDQIREITALLDFPAERQELEKDGPLICPFSPRIEKNLDFQISRVSDCVVISAEISPAGAINLVSYCSKIVKRLLMRGIMCRGYISQGPIFHLDNEFYGRGYHEVLEGEKSVEVFKQSADERGTPFVEVDPKVYEFIGECDEVVREVFSKQTKRDSNGIALFPFQDFAHGFIIQDPNGNLFDRDKERKQNDFYRQLLIKYRKFVESHLDMSNPKAVSKGKHYINAINNQIKVCDQTDEWINF